MLKLLTIKGLFFKTDSLKADLPELELLFRKVPRKLAKAHSLKQYILVKHKI